MEANWLWHGVHRSRFGSDIKGKANSWIEANQEKKKIVTEHNESDGDVDG